MIASRNARLLLACAALLLLPAGSALSEPNNAELLCPPERETLDHYRYLRALSLDLRGVVPAWDEYDALDAADGNELEIIAGLVDGWLQSPEFTERVVRLHNSLLWNNVGNVNLISANFSMRRDFLGPNDFLYWRTNPALTYRGMRVGCLDQPVEYNPDGSIRTYPQPDGSNREGYVWVTPYWDSETSIKVCAFDAQENVTAPSGARCNSNEGATDAGCGCGPDLSWCSWFQTMGPVLDAMSQDIDRRVRDAVNDGDYLQLFTGRVGYVNGPLVHYWRNMTGVFAGVRSTPEPLPMEQLPDLDYADTDTWVPLHLGDEHAGVLTSPGFLFRFQTNRARANRFYNAFLCQPFQPPDSGLASGTEELPVLDLQVRSGCKYCHAILEPAGSYWGRWTEQGAGYLDPGLFPPVREDCERCARTGQGCSDECNRYYTVNALTSEEEPYLGMLSSYKFRRAEHMDFVEQGPEMLALTSVIDGRLPECSARTAAGWLLGREPAADELGWVDELARGFVSSGHDYRELVRAVVLSEQYRRVR